MSFFRMAWFCHGMNGPLVGHARTARSCGVGAHHFVIGLLDLLRERKVVVQTGEARKDLCMHGESALRSPAHSGCSHCGPPHNP